MFISKSTLFACYVISGTLYYSMLKVNMKFVILILGILLLLLVLKVLMKYLTSNLNNQYLLM